MTLEKRGFLLADDYIILFNRGTNMRSYVRSFDLLILLLLLEGSHSLMKSQRIISQGGDSCLTIAEK